MKYFVLGII